MKMELRKDPITRSWVITGDDGADAATQGYSCPFCPEGGQHLQVVSFVPRLIVALVILAFGAYFARFIAGAVMAYCRNVGIQDGDLLGRLAQYAILAFVVLIALEQVQIGGDIVRMSFLIVLADVLCIFRESRQCLHDQIADTLVVKVGTGA